MYCNLTRTQGFPMAIRVSLQQTKAKSCVPFSNSSYLPVKFYVNPKGSAFADVSTGFSRGKTQKSLLVRSGLNEMLGKLQSVRDFSSFGSQRFGKRTSNNGTSRGKSARLGSRAFPERRSGDSGRGDSIWVKSDEKPVEERFQRGNRSSWDKRDGRNDSVSADRRSRYRGQGETRNRGSFRARGDDRGAAVEEESTKSSGNSIWVANDKTEKEQLPRGNRSSWEKGDGRTRNQNSFRARGDDRITEVDDDSVNYYANEDDDRIVEEGETERIDEEPVDTRWSEIKTRFNRYDVRDQGRDNEAYRNWNRQESWGRKTWQEATESSVPRMVGEVVYGVSPVLAALSVGRREFYVLYVQEGLDLSSNNRKKKDKKGFEKVLKISEKLGLTVKETSKHDLNMVADNRPHQGLVLDASPLELVKVKELDPIASEEEKSSLWVALDEVTDPQNLGAIIRSAYFFGATGVVVCAKNSAPLSAVVSKASAGSLEVMELRYCKNMMQFLSSSAENGWRVIGGSVSPKAVALNEVLPGSPTILVLGNEGTGLRPLVERSCTDLVRITGNMPNDVVPTESDDVESEGLRSFLAVESLNVSVAAGLFLHHLIGNKTSV